MFAKVFGQIFDSSIAEKYQTRHVFIDLLILADSEGVVDMTHQAIARRTNVPLGLVIDAIKELLEPDPASRSKEDDGRRLQRLDEHREWGWRIVNYLHYRQVIDEDARRSYFRDYRRKQRADKAGAVQSVQPCSTKFTQGEGEGEAEGVKRRALSPARPEGWPDTELKARSMATTAGVDPELAATFWNHYEGNGAWPRGSFASLVKSKQGFKKQDLADKLAVEQSRALSRAQGSPAAPPKKLSAWEIEKRIDAAREAKAGIMGVNSYKHLSDEKRAKVDKLNDSIRKLKELLTQVPE